jgi:hypothetical protein
MKKWMLTACLAAVCASGGAWAFPWYASGEGIWGADLMTREERLEYVKHIREMKSYEECKAYLAAHRKALEARAQARNMTLPPPAGSPCDAMERMGRFSGKGAACPAAK